MPRPRRRTGTTDWMIGPTITNAVRSSAAGKMPTIANSVSLGIRYWSGKSTATGHEQQADQAQRVGGIAPVQRVVAPRDERQRDEHARARDRGDDAPPERADVEVPVEVQVLQHRPGEHAEADRREAEQHRPERADAVAAAERGRERHGDLVRRPVTSPSTSSISCWPRSGSGRRKARIAKRDRRQGEHEVRPAPTVAAARERGDPAHDRRARHRGQADGTADGRVDATAHTDRIRVRDERALRRDTRSSLATPAPRRATKSANALAASPHANAHRREHQRRPADDRRAPARGRSACRSATGRARRTRPPPR